MSKPYISYIEPSTMKDAAMLAELDRCKSYGTPRPESQAIRAHVPAVFWSFANSWRDVFHTGIADHGIKELCRLYVSRSVLCEFCGNQRSIKAANAITWDLPVDEKFWARLHKHFNEPELVEIGYFIALTMGQQRWLRTLNIEHHQVLAGTDASMAPGFQTEEELKRSKAQADYWAKKPAQPQTQAAE